MADEIMGKRTNGARRSGDGSSGAGSPPARRGRHETRKLVADFRDHCDDFEASCYRAHSLEGPDGAAIWRKLADRIEALMRIAGMTLPLLRAEAIDMEKGSKSVADDLPKDPPENP